MNHTIFNKEQLNKIIRELLDITQFPFNLSYEIIKQVKTKRQLGFIWGGLLVDLANYKNEEGETLGEEGRLRKWTPEDVKLWLYHNILGTAPIVLSTGEVIYYQKTMSNMDKEEMSEFITKVIDFVDENTDCILRPELRNTWLLHVDKPYYDQMESCQYSQYDRGYLRYQSRQPCLYCGVRDRISPHHLRREGQGGTATKPPDWLTIPLCYKCHDFLHRGNETEVIQGLSIYKLDVKDYCKLCYAKWKLKL